MSRAAQDVNPRDPARVINLVLPPAAAICATPPLPRCFRLAGVDPRQPLGALRLTDRHLLPLGLATIMPDGGDTRRIVPLGDAEAVLVARTTSHDGVGPYIAIVVRQ